MITKHVLTEVALAYKKAHTLCRINVEKLEQHVCKRNISIELFVSTNHLLHDHEAFINRGGTWQLLQLASNFKLGP